MKDLSTPLKPVISCESKLMRMWPIPRMNSSSIETRYCWKKARRKRDRGEQKKTVRSARVGPGCENQSDQRWTEEFLDFSDEEVLAESLSESAESAESDGSHEDHGATRKREKINSRSIALHESDSDAVAGPEEDDEAGEWGISRRDYYNADTIETEADALEEEAEARRLQQKQLQGLTEEDFGFDEKDWLEAGKPGTQGADDDVRNNVIREVLPGLEITDAMGPEERLKIIKTRYPEFDPLRKELIELQALHEELELAAKASTAVDLHTQLKLNGNESKGIYEDKTPVAVVKHCASSAYLAALCMYFVLLTSGSTDQNGRATAMPPAELRNHTVMNVLVQCRELWGKVKDIPIPNQSGMGDGLHESLNDDASQEGLDIGVQDPEKPTNSEIQLNKDVKRVHKTKAEKAHARAQAEAEALRLERINKTEQDLLTLDALISSSKPSKSFVQPSRKRNGSPLSSDFGEQTFLTAREASEKAKSKKSLRFYTSQIAQKSQKRDNAGRDAGGDNDVPYRERLRDRQERLNVEAESRGKKTKNDKKNAALGGDSDEEDRRIATELRGSPDEEDYYAQISAQSALKKAQKLAHASSISGPPSAHPRPEDPITHADGKRAITYAIEKNKGLAPRRKKDVRNPRVKKRRKFEAKTKKLASVRQVYRGGEGKGGYEGEKTGIKMGVVRGVKL